MDRLHVSSNMRFTYFRHYSWFCMLLNLGEKHCAHSFLVPPPFEGYIEINGFFKLILLP